jgi:hypothetical protein
MWCDFLCDMTIDPLNINIFMKEPAKFLKILIFKYKYINI